MASTDSLLDAHEVAVRARVEELREETARVAAALGEAELALEHVVITRATLAVVLAGPGAQAAGGQHADTGAPPAGAGRVPVPAWTAGLDEQALPAGYRELWRVLAAAPAGARCKQAAMSLGLEPVPTNVEGTRSKLRRLVRRGGRSRPRPGCSRRCPSRPRSAGSRLGRGSAPGCGPGQAAGHHVGQRPADHRLVGVGAAFVVPHAPAPTGDPAEGAFSHPSTLHVWMVKAVNQRR